MIESTPNLPENPEPAMSGSPWFRLDAKAFAKLDSVATARGISFAEALHRLLEAGARHLESEEPPELKSLSQKQWKVLESLKAGLSVKEIAEQLGVSEGTVRTHIHRIRQRCDCADLLSLRFQREGNPGGSEAHSEAIHPGNSAGL